MTLLNFIPLLRMDCDTSTMSNSTSTSGSNTPTFLRTISQPLSYHAPPKKKRMLGSTSDLLEQAKADSLIDTLSLSSETWSSESSQESGGMDIEEKAVIWDDFRGHYCSFTDFKLCVDRYPLRVEVKGTTCNLAANHFFITTNYDPSDWWTEEVTGSDRSAIFRRITRVLWVPLPGQFRSFPSYEAYRQEVLIPRPADTEIPVLTQINWDAPQI